MRGWKQRSEGALSLLLLSSDLSSLGSWACPYPTTNQQLIQLKMSPSYSYRKKLPSLLFFLVCLSCWEGEVLCFWNLLTLGGGKLSISGGRCLRGGKGYMWKVSVCLVFVLVGEFPAPLFVRFTIRVRFRVRPGCHTPWLTRKKRRQKTIREETMTPGNHKTADCRWYRLISKP
jgi:hypothetical protein